jgi:uncharacterized pyridoxal phosphate-containing UPF0001 family protein
LFAIETVDSKKLAQKLDEVFVDQHPLVFIQVNTSDEESKSGVSATECVELATYLRSLTRLRFAGLMTIGAPENSIDDFNVNKRGFLKCFVRDKPVSAEIGRVSK